MFKRTLACVVMLGATLLSLAAAPPKPVGIFAGTASERLGELLHATVFTPQWSPDQPVSQPFAWTDWESFSAILLLYGDGAPLRLRDLTGERIAAAENFVRQGGTLIILADKAPLPGLHPIPAAALQTLLGATTWTPLAGPAEILDASWQEAGHIPEVFAGMLSPPGAALTGLSTARPLIGHADGALATVNALGLGQVYFFNVKLTQSLTPYPQPYSRNANAALEQLFPFVQRLHQIIMAAGAATTGTPRERWEPVPLGPAVQALPVLPPRIPSPLPPFRRFQPLNEPPLSLVRAGNADALIILSGSGQAAAARRLNALLQKMSGATLPAVNGNAVAADGDRWRWRGQTYASQIRFAPGENGIHITASAGTVTIAADDVDQGMVTFMRDFLHYRMLWPGPAGEVFQRGENVTAPAAELTDAPFLAERAIRNAYASGLNTWTAPDGTTLKLACPTRQLDSFTRLGLDPREALESLRGHGDWWPVQRLGGRLKAAGGANFYGWPEKYADKKEWFAMQFDGTRSVRSQDVRICKSNPDVIRASAAAVAEAVLRQPGLEYYHLSPSDGGYDIMCMCAGCRQWDPQTSLGLCTRRVFLGRNRPVFRYPGYTDRVLRYTLAVADAVRPRCPQVTLFYLAYSGYAAPPLTITALPDNVAVTYVGLQYLNDRKLAEDRQTWDHWAALAGKLRLRPNLLLEGMGLPVLYPTKLAWDLRHGAETGMIGADFDSLSHHWATQGLNYYVLAQLLWDPTLSAAEIIDDYCQRGFGPAADAVKEYFTRCENLTSRIAAADTGNMAELEDLTHDEYASFIRKAGYYFSADLLAELAACLDRAATAAGTDTPERTRVDFLRDGLRSAELQAGFLRQYYAAPVKKELKPQVERYVAELKALYQKQPFACNLTAITTSQWPLWRDCGWKTP